MRGLPGWDAEDHLAALLVVRRVCKASPAQLPERLCGEAEVAPATDAAARDFLEAHFRPERIAGEGVLTAYFAPTYPARERPEGEFSAPVRSMWETTSDRAAIEAAPLASALAWMRPEDLYFLQIQGSGELDFANGRRLRAVYAGSNGRPYVAIASAMAARGLIAEQDANASGVHAWLAAHRGPQADAIMRLNPRYIFFRLVPDDGAEPRGASGATLIAGRSLAVDPAYHGYFGLYWVDADQPALAGARQTYRRLAAALDTGSAIKGGARADLYLGRGAAAGAEAGTVRHRLTLYRLVPVSP